jgi:hypothetical protein
MGKWNLVLSFASHQSLSLREVVREEIAMMAAIIDRIVRLSSG